MRDCNEDYRREAYEDRMRESVCRDCPGSAIGDCASCRWSGDYEDGDGEDDNESEEDGNGQ